MGFLFEYDPPAEANIEEADSHRIWSAAPSIRPPSLVSPRAYTCPPHRRQEWHFAAWFCRRRKLCLFHAPPAPREEPDLELAHVATRRSLSAVNVQRKFGFRSTSTDPDTVFGDESIDAVFIVTRHSSHADMTCRALEAGKAVFVEKPLALTVDELDRILATVDATGNDRLMVGFNRRFAPLLMEMRSRFGRSSEPTSARYLVNAGRLASDSWYGDVELEGSRFVGEGGHFVDTMSWWIGSDPIEVLALPAGRPRTSR